jgi:putative transposase
LRDYHARPHGETKAPPLARWQRSGFLPRMAGSLEQPDLLLLTVAKTRKIQADGVLFQGMRCQSAAVAGRTHSGPQSAARESLVIGTA